MEGGGRTLGGRTLGRSDARTLGRSDGGRSDGVRSDGVRTAAETCGAQKSVTSILNFCGRTRPTEQPSGDGYRQCA